MASRGFIQLSPYTSALANNVTPKQPSLKSHETHTAKHLNLFHVPCFPHIESLRRPWVTYSVLKVMLYI